MIQVSGQGREGSERGEGNEGDGTRGGVKGMGQEGEWGRQKGLVISVIGFTKSNAGHAHSMMITGSELLTTVL